MKNPRFLGLCTVLSLMLIAPVALAAQSGGVDVGPAHPEIGTLQQILDDLAAGALDFDDLRRFGLSVFSTPFNTYDGLGDGPFDPSELDTAAFGHRPTLQGNGQILRVNGLDAQSCNECHSLVSHRTRPPQLGLGGVGGMVQNAIIMPTLIDVADSFDDRVLFQSGHDPELDLVFDGVADFNGRFSNPPFLFGGGGVEALAKEMTQDLQKLLAIAQSSPAGTTVVLKTHGVRFGSITSLGGGQVDLSAVQGVGFADNSTHDPADVLVVRPFGRKGENFSMRDFDRGAMQFHFGVQPVEVVGEDVDEDGDSVTNEVSVAEMSMLHIFSVTNPVPVVDTSSLQARSGFKYFRDIGCSKCHIPALVTNSPSLPLAHPEVANAPYDNVYLKIDLTEVGFQEVSNGGVIVPLFADLKRHAMGPRLAETFERGGDVAQDEFTTARLWGIADTAPYLHDGRATTLYQAIEFHGGEAQTVRDQFLNLSDAAQKSILAFLMTLRTPEEPNEELLPLDP